MADGRRRQIHSGRTEGERCGGRGSRTFRRAFPAASGLSRTFDDLGPLDGGHIVADSVPDPRISGGAAMKAIRSPPAVTGSNLRSPCRRHTC